MTATLVCDALKQAICRSGPPRGLVCHSDRGVQYASRAYRALLKKYGFIQSMSRKGNCWDNAPMESSYSKPSFAIKKIIEPAIRPELPSYYVESFYNRARLQVNLAIFLHTTTNLCVFQRNCVSTLVVRGIHFLS